MFWQTIPLYHCSPPHTLCRWLQALHSFCQGNSSLLCLSRMVVPSNSKTYVFHLSALTFIIISATYLHTFIHSFMRIWRSPSELVTILNWYFDLSRVGFLHGNGWAYERTDVDHPTIHWESVNHIAGHQQSRVLEKNCPLLFTIPLYQSFVNFLPRTPMWTQKWDWD